MTPLLIPSLAMAQGAVTATLSVLTAPVERIAGDAGAPEPGVTGMNLAEGDRIRTGAGGVALITFLNGSTVTLLSDTEVTVKQAPTGRAKAAGIRMLIHAGRVWARVAQAAGSRSTLTLESNDYTATAHDGLIGAEQSSAGTFVCWTRRGTLWLTDRSGQTDTVLVAGQRARARFGHAGDGRALRAEREHARDPYHGAGGAAGAHARRQPGRGISRARRRGQPGLRLADRGEGWAALARGGAGRPRGPLHLDPDRHRHGPVHRADHRALRRLLRLPAGHPRARRGPASGSSPASRRP